MLRCVSRYRSQGLGLFLEPGEVVHNCTPDLEALLLRDSPGSFEVVAAAEPPPEPKPAEREKAARAKSERGGGAAMTKADHPGLAR